MDGETRSGVSRVPEEVDEAKAPLPRLRRDHSSPHSDILPERRLMVAMMHDAMRCLEKYRNACDPPGRRRFAEEAEWVLSNDNSRVHSFVRICETLELDPTEVRRSLGMLYGRRRGSFGLRADLSVVPARKREA